MYAPYNKFDLISQIDKISIEQVGNQVITKYNGTIKSIATVSDKYEIFDIKTYMKSKIDAIESNFKIDKYQLVIIKGIQQLNLLSEDIDINGIKFQKGFFILNSSDKSRRLSFDIGIKSPGIYAVFAGNLSLHKKHLIGVSKSVEDKFTEINGEIFSDQIENIRSLVGHKISFSNLQKVIVDDFSIKSNHLKFDSLKNNFYYLFTDKRIKLSPQESLLLRTPSLKIDPSLGKDFYLDAFDCFMMYLKSFQKCDSHLIKNETSRIMNMTQYSIRNNILNSIGI